MSHKGEDGRSASGGNANAASGLNGIAADSEPNAEGGGRSQAAGALAAAKAALRKRMAAARDALTPQEREQRSTALCLRFLEAWAETLLQARERGQALAAFVPFRSEADVMPIVRWCWERNVQVALPRVEAAHILTLHLVAGEHELAPGAYGIREPEPRAPRLEHNAVALALVPGLAFDAAGRRLGYGGGYYDRLIQQLQAPASQQTILVAPAFEAQIVDAVPAEPHDATVRFIVTEARIITTREDEP